MGAEQIFRFNKWGVAGILSLVASIPLSEVLAAALGEQSTASILPAFILLLVSIGCGVVAATRGHRSWLVVSLVAAVFAFFAVLGIIGE